MRIPMYLVFKSCGYSLWIQIRD